MAINVIRVHQKLQSHGSDKRISEEDLFKAAIVGSEEDDDYGDFITMMDLEAEMQTVERRVHDGQLWYRGQGA